MDFGRKTPLAMTAPWFNCATRPPLQMQDILPDCQQQEDTMLIMTGVPPAPLQHARPMQEIGSTRRTNTFWNEIITTQDGSLTQLLPSFTTVLASNLAAVSSTVATTICLGWAVYSRAFRSDLEIWTCISSSKDPTTGKEPSNLSFKNPGNLQATHETQIEIPESLPRLCPKMSALPPSEDGAIDLMENGRELASSSRFQHRNKDTQLATHDVLCKHYEYLLLWVSSQPGSPVEDSSGETSNTSSDSRMSSELRQMSLRHFTDLSGAIYRDVRRREKDSSPERTPLYKCEPWTRNRQNESRMVLCRTINEHFYHLVMALVLEQARRLAALRMRMHRHGLASN